MSGPSLRARSTGPLPPRQRARGGCLADRPVSGDALDRRVRRQCGGERAVGALDRRRDRLVPPDAEREIVHGDGGAGAGGHRQRAHGDAPRRVHIGDADLRRVGALPEPRQLTSGARVVFAPEAQAAGSEIPTTYEGLARDVEPGATILLDDGLLSVEVEDVKGERVSNACATSELGDVAARA